MLSDEPRLIRRPRPSKQVLDPPLPTCERCHGPLRGKQIRFCCENCRSRSNYWSSQLAAYWKEERGA